MIYTLQRLTKHKGELYACIRDYDILKHKRAKKVMRVVCPSEAPDEYMDLKGKDFNKYIMITSNLFPGNYGVPFHLWSYEWKPKSVKEEAEKRNKQLLGY